jgi:predicted nucleotidyltransferase
MKGKKIDIEYLKKELVKRLISLNPEKIILFGSYIYGNPDNDSDIDICVVNSGRSSKIEVKRAIRSLLKDLKIAKDILTPSKEEYDFYKNEFGSVYKEIEEKGKVLWPVS